MIQAMKRYSLCFLALLVAFFSTQTAADPPPEESPAHPSADKSQTFEIRTYSPESGGTSAGDDYELRGVMAQPDAGPPLEGGDFAVQGGLLALGSPVDQGVIFCDGFESGDTTSWTFVSSP